MSAKAERNVQPKMVGRAEELDLFRNQLGMVQRGEEPRRFMHFYGTGGIGKSVLLKACQALCRERGVANAMISFEKGAWRELLPQDAVAEMLLIIAEQLSDQGRSTMQRLLAKRTALVDAARPKGHVAVEVAESTFANNLGPALAALANAEPVVLFVDNVELASDELRNETEQVILSCLALAARGLVVSASRADLVVTWEGQQRDLFDKFHMQPLSVRDLAALYEGDPSCNSVEGKAVRQSAVLARLIHEVGREHPLVTLQVTNFLAGLYKGDPGITAHGLNPQQERELYANLYESFLRRWAFYEIDPGT